MKVRQLITLLQQCDPEQAVVVLSSFQGLREVELLERRECSELERQYSWEKEQVVEIIACGSADHMRSQGRDILAPAEEPP